MFSPLYYLIVGSVTILLQLTWRRRLYTFIFFFLLLFAPTIRSSYNLPYEAFYLATSIGWMSLVFLLEDNKIRLFLTALGTVVASHFSFDLILKIGSVEVIVFGFMWNTYLDKFIFSKKEGIKRGSSKILEMGGNVIFNRHRLDSILPEHELDEFVEREREADSQIRRIEQKLTGFDEISSRELRETSTEA